MNEVTLKHMLIAVLRSCLRMDIDPLQKLF